ncbi:MAG: hypothetical protein HC809_01685 [Gammaproteobacteria bacterium]|nr:hypothetical protein [Gammaproteobacteria bacterium]
MWSKAGTEVAYTRVPAGGGDRQVVVHTPGQPAAVLFSAKGAWYVLDFSPDDARILVRHYVSINESYLYEFDRHTGALNPLLDLGLRIAIGTARYDQDGGVLFTSDLGSEFVRLHRLALTSGRIELLSGDLAWDVETFEVAA